MELIPKSFCSFSLFSLRQINSVRFLFWLVVSPWLFIASIRLGFAPFKTLFTLEC